MANAAAVKTLFGVCCLYPLLAFAAGYLLRVVLARGWIHAPRARSKLHGGGQRKSKEMDEIDDQA